MTRPRRFPRTPIVTPRRAQGGLVDSRGVYVVGTGDPELLVESGKRVSLTIDAKNVGVANPVDVGRQIVKAINDYFRAGGPPPVPPFK